MNLEIIVKTCDGETIHGKNSERYCGESKQNLISKCLSSLVVSSNIRPIDTTITVIDDASSNETIEMMERILSNSKWKTEIIHREKNNYNEATLQYFERARDSESTLVYCVEDDYLHFPSCIPEMDSFYQHAFNQLGKQKDVILHPFDDPDNYRVRFMEKSYIVLGFDRHWRTNSSTTCTFYTTTGVIQRNWELFETFATGYGKDPNINEQTTICRAWNRPDAQLFTPMRSLALHMQFQENMDVMVNWQKLWETTPDLSINKSI